MAVYKTDITSSSTLAAVLGSATIPFGGCWVTFVSSVDCWIHFGGDTDSAASAVYSFPMKAQETYDWWVNDTSDPNFRVIRAGTDDGVLTRYRSNL